MKMIFSLFVILATLWAPNADRASAAEPKTYYAQITSSGSSYYSSPSDTEQSRMFELPKFYYVLLTGESGEFYSAVYMGDLFGFVKKSDVSPVSGKPTKEYPFTSFRCFSQVELPIYASPTDELSPIGSLASGQKLVKWYGTKKGKELMDNTTNDWFFCSSGSGPDKVQGYVFSYYCDSRVYPSEDYEFLPTIDGAISFDGSEGAAAMSDTVVAIIILAVCLPCLVILYLLLSPSKRRKKEKTKSEKGKLLKRGKDYYEFSEDDLN